MRFQFIDYLTINAEIKMKKKIDESIEIKKLLLLQASKIERKYKKIKVSSSIPNDNNLQN